MFQTVFHPPLHPSVQTKSLQTGDKDSMANHVKGLAKVKDSTAPSCPQAESSHQKDQGENSLVEIKTD